METAKGLRDWLAARVTAPSYGVQRQVVAFMFETIARLLEGASQTDAEIQDELRSFPEGYVIGFAVLGDTPTMRLRVRGGRFERVGKGTKPDLAIVFKHVSHAFLIVTFQESTARAFANDRALTHGDIALGMRFVRCLNRMEALALPPFVARRALKEPLPALPLREHLALTGKLFGRVGRGLAKGKAS